MISYDKKTRHLIALQGEVATFDIQLEEHL